MLRKPTVKKPESPTRAPKATAKAASPSRRGRSPGRPKAAATATSNAASATASADTTKAKPTSASKSPVKTTATTKPPTTPRPKSPARSRSAGRKSPSRAKTVESSPKRKKSPARVTHSEPAEEEPVRRSAARAPKSKPKEPEVSRLIAEDFEVEPAKKESSPRVTRRLNIKLEKVTLTNDDFYRGTAIPPSDERIVHLHQSEIARKKLGAYSDDDDDADSVQSKSRALDGASKPEFGGALGALFLMVATPIAMVAVDACCNAQSCAFTLSPPNVTKYLSPQTYFESRAFLGVGAFSALVALLSAVPIGRKVFGLPNRQGKLAYVMNGLLTALVTVLIYVGLEQQKVGVTDYIVDHTLHMLVAAFVLSFCATIHLFVRSFYVPLTALNTHVVGKSKVYSFFVGRELNPRIFKVLDVKMYLLRIGLIGAIILECAFLYKSVHVPSSISFYKLSVHPTLLVLIATKLIYFFDVLVFEHTWVTSFEVQYEGVGYMSMVGYFIYPFMTASITKYVYDYKAELPVWALVLITCVFFIGYFLFRGSNSQKDAFRKNPYNPKVSHLETISSRQGRRLIVSGYWGFVRHPNYLGDIIMNLCFLATVGLVPPAIYFAGIVVLLVHRSVRDNARCQQKYAETWDKYCSKVKYVLIPKIY